MLILLRSTTGCNLRCRYCSVACGETERRDLTEDDCRLLRDSLPSLLREGESVRFLWHGGEPTLLAPERFRAMLGILSELERDGHPVEYAMQTNGFRISDAWLDILERHAIGVGLSLDGPAALHDAERVTPAGEGSYARIMDGMAAMLERGVPVSLLCTVRPAHLGREAELLDWLTPLGRPVRFNPLLPLGRSAAGLAPGDYFRFLQRLLALALERQVSLSIEPLSWMLASVITDAPPRECSWGGRCGQSVFGFGPGGEVLACNRSDERYGNLRERSLRALYDAAPWRKRRERSARLRARCGDCAVWRYCHGGCPVVEGEEPDATRCEARRAFFDWLRGEGLFLYQQSLVRRRSELRERLRLLRRSKEGLARHMPDDAPTEDA